MQRTNLPSALNKLTHKEGHIKNIDVAVWSICYAFYIALLFYIFLNFTFFEDITDILGYYVHSATLCGIDWSSILKFCSNYAWGYSLFILPVFRLCLINPFWMVKAVFIENAMISVLSIPLMNGMLKRTTSLSSIERCLCCFVTSLLTCELFNVSRSVCEILLIFLGYLAFYSFLRFSEKRGWGWLLLWLFSVDYSYATHKRMLVFVFVSICILIVMTIKKKATIIQLISGTAIAVIGVFGSEIIQNWFTQREAGIYGGYTSQNSYSSQVNKLFEKSFLEAVIGTLQRVLGECWYVSAATLIVGIFGFVFVLYVSFSKNPNYPEFKANKLFFIYILSSFVMAALLSAYEWNSGALLNLFGTWRLDSLFPGRYFENLLGTIFIYALAFIFHYAKDNFRLFIKISLISVAISLISFLSLSFEYNNIGKPIIGVEGYIYYYAAPGVSLLSILGKHPFVSYSIIFISSYILMMVLVFLVSRNKMNSKLMCIVIFLLLSSYLLFDYDKASEGNPNIYNGCEQIAVYETVIQAKPKRICIYTEKWLEPIADEDVDKYVEEHDEFPMYLDGNYYEVTNSQLRSYCMTLWSVIAPLFPTTDKVRLDYGENRAQAGDVVFIMPDSYSKFQQEYADEEYLVIYSSGLYLAVEIIGD